MNYKPVNPDTSRSNKNTLYLGGSGCGKSQAVKHNKELLHAKRLILWDVNCDHAGIHTESRIKFLELLLNAIPKKAPFSIGFCGNDIDDFEFFCSVVWSVLDGNCETYVIAEELSHVCKSSGKASVNAARLLNQGRKYGLVFHGVSQKPQEISKTFYDQCERKYVGRFSGDNARKMARYLFGDVSERDVESLKNLEFLYDSGQSEKIRRVKYQFKKTKKITLV